jgi:hypothetical protein
MMSIDNAVIARTTRFPFPCASVPSVDNTGPLGRALPTGFLA